MPVHRQAFCKLYVEEFYIKSSAKAKKVTLKGNIIEQQPPPIAYTQKKTAIDTKNRSQYNPVDFFVVVAICNNYFGKYKIEDINANDF